MRKPSGPAATRIVNHLRLGEALLEHEGPADPRALHRGQQSGGDLPRGHKVRRGLAREDLFTVVHDPFMTDTATLRRHRAAGGDLSRDRRSLPRLRHLLDAVGPAGRAAAGRGVVQLRGWRRRSPQRMGLTDPVFRMSPQDDVAGAVPRRDRPGRGRRSAKLFAGGPIHIAHEGGQQFRTPSGKLEFYSEQLAEAGPPADAGLAARSREDGRSRQLAAAPADRAGLLPEPHRLLRRRLPAPARGQAVLRAASGRRAHARPRRGRRRCGCFNDRGAIGLVLRVSDEVQPGVVLVPGQRPTSEAVSGTINMLCSDRYTDMGDGATYQSTWLDVAAWEA